MIVNIERQLDRGKGSPEDLAKARILLEKLNETNKCTSNNFKAKWKEFEQLKREGTKIEAVDFLK